MLVTAQASFKHQSEQYRKRLIEELKNLPGSVCVREQDNMVGKVVSVFWDGEVFIKIDYPNR